MKFIRIGVRLFLAKLFRIPRRLRMIYYIRFNRLKFWANGVRFGANMRVYSKMYLSMMSGSKITIGDNFVYTHGDAFNPLCRNIRGCIYTAYPHSSITIGNDTGMSSACLRASTFITVGNHVNIGGDCIIMDTDAHSLDYMIRRSREKDADGFGVDGLSAVTAPIVIEDDVLIGARCIILKGVTIGARSIIGSGSVVVKSIPADCIAAGNPCKIIRYINGK